MCLTLLPFSLRHQEAQSNLEASLGEHGTHGRDCLVQWDFLALRAMPTRGSPHGLPQCQG